MIRLKEYKKEWDRLCYMNHMYMPNDLAWLPLYELRALESLFIEKEVVDDDGFVTLYLKKMEDFYV